MALDRVDIVPAPDKRRSGQLSDPIVACHRSRDFDGAIVDIGPGMLLNRVSRFVSRLVARCGTERRWVYVACIVPVSLLGLLSTEESFLGAIPYAGLAGLLLVQFVKPTIAGWLIAFGAFAAYGTAVLWVASGPLGEILLLAVPFGVLPASVLLWTRPRRLRGR